MATMRIFELFYYICIAGMVLAFFGPNLTALNVPNIFDRYRYLLKHRFECNIRINGTDEDEPNDQNAEDDENNAITVGSTRSSRTSPENVTNFAKSLVRHLKSGSSSQQRTPDEDSLLQETVDKIFKNKSLHKSLSKDFRNLTEHGNLKSIVDKISEVAANGQSLTTMEDVAKAVNNIFKDVQGLEDENADNGMRKIFEHLSSREEDSDEYSSSE